MKNNMFGNVRFHVVVSLVLVPVVNTPSVCRERCSDANVWEIFIFRKQNIFEPTNSATGRTTEVNIRSAGAYREKLDRLTRKSTSVPERPVERVEVVGCRSTPVQKESVSL